MGTMYRRITLTNFEKMHNHMPESLFDRNDLYLPVEKIESPFDYSVVYKYELAVAHCCEDFDW